MTVRTPDTYLTEVQAMRWTGDNTSDVIDWVLSTGTRAARWHEGSPGFVAQWIALDGNDFNGYRVEVGDWVVLGANGAHYPYKPDVFNATHERVTSITRPYPEQPGGKS